MTTTIFYSWQSDLPNKHNRGFIQTALERAARAIRNDESIQVEPVVDRDTANVGGAPDIAATIFGKIAQAAVAVFDVSLITGIAPVKGRPSPNPNVLIELGYAAHALGWNRIVLVFNKAYGPVEALPFDLKMRRVTVYVADDDSDRAAARKQLQAALEAHLRTMFSGVGAATATSGDQKALPATVELVVQQPLPDPTRDSSTGIWTREIEIKASRPEAVHDVFVEVEFDREYREGGYQVVPEDPTSAMMLRERFGTKGAINSKVFTMGLVELPRRCSIKLTFKSTEPITPVRMGVNPFVDRA